MNQFNYTMMPAKCKGHHFLRARGVGDENALNEKIEKANSSLF